VPDLLTLEDAKEALRLKDEDSTRDDILAVFIEGVTSIVEERVGWVTERDETVEVRSCGPAVVLQGMNILSLTSGASISDDSVVDVSGMYADAAGILRNKDGSHLPTSPWRLTMVVGMDPIPEAIRRAAAEILIQGWATQRQKPGETPAAFLVPNRAAAWLSGFERPPRVA
jgi:hypothetical protein